MSQFSDTAVLENSNETTRRRKIDPTTCERDYSNEEMEFMDILVNICERLFIYYYSDFKYFYTFKDAYS